MPKMNENDPAYWMLTAGHESTPTVYDLTCYICTDDEFRRMGLPLCYPCPYCTAEGGEGTPSGHVPADDTVCTVCNRDTYPPEYQPIDGVPQVTSLPDIAEYVDPAVTVPGVRILGSLADVQARVRAQIEQDREAGL